MSLRGILAISAGVFGGMAAATALWLVVSAAQMASLAIQIGEAVESVRLAEAIEIELLRHARIRNLIATGDMSLLDETLSSARNIEAQVQQIAAHVGTREEGVVLNDATAAIRAYLSQPLAASATDPASAIRQTFEEVEPVLGTLDRLVAINVADARRFREETAWWGEAAQVAGFLIGALLIGSALVLAWAARTAIRPAFDLAQQMRTFSAGEPARAVEAGASELREIARTFNEMADRLDRHRQQQLTFLAGVAHDLRNPLNALRMTGIFDRAALSPDDARRVVRIVQRQVETLNRMVGDLLDATRIEAGQLDLQLVDCDLRALLDEVVELYADQPTHRVEVEHPAGPLVLQADPVRLSQVLGNLVSNAIKYSPVGSVVRTATRRLDGALAIEVCDQGDGIPEQELERIFEPFRRVSRPGEHVKGVGLGLTVARRIVRAHGGELTVRSSPEGTTFQVRLPLSRTGRVPQRADAVGRGA